jgi:hypothetical protein
VEPSLELSTNNRIGLHYFPDTLHYRARDLEIWLPHLSRMGMGWLTLLAPLERAIPEFFLEGLFSSGLQPVLHFQVPIQTSTSSEELCLLFSSYARWGVQYVALYDRPNSRSNWSPSAWAQMDLVERFLDQYVPLAEAALDEGLVPIFPPLEPGGDYWDLSFLQSALRGLQRRGQNRLLDSLALGAYAWAGNRSLEWGAGGPERWSQVVPYSTPAESEDQRGFRIFDWYLAISQRELGKRLPLFLLRVGSTPNDHLDPTNGEPDYLAHAGQNLSIARLLANEPVEGCSPVPPEVIAANFWLLAAHEKSPFTGQSWFRTEEEKLPVVNSFYRLAARQMITGVDGEVLETSEDPQTQNSESPAEQPQAELESSPEPGNPISDRVEAAQPLETDPEPICEAAAVETANPDEALTDLFQTDQPELQENQPNQPESQPEQPVLQQNQPEQLELQLEQQEPQSVQMDLQPEQPEHQQGQPEQLKPQLEQQEPESDQMDLQPDQPELQQGQPEQLEPRQEQQEPQLDQVDPQPEQPESQPEQFELQPQQPESQPAKPAHSISHYVLLPLYAWGAADWDLDVIQPFLQESHPTVGFSLTEARLASRVTVVGGDGAISEEALDMLRAAGCKVERVMDDGTLIAS